MSSTSEKTYGSRVGNAEKMLGALQSFGDYAPRHDNASISVLNDLIIDIRTRNTEVASNKQSFSLAVEVRRQYYDKGADSIKNRLAPINATVKTVYGRQSKEAADTAALIAKMRGANIKATKPAEESVSQSYQSYNSKIQFFSDLIVNLDNFGSDYDPTDARITVGELRTLHDNALQANVRVMDAYSRLVMVNANRVSSYAALTETAARIKDGVAAQYGFHSPQYRLIRGLSI